MKRNLILIAVAALLLVSVHSFAEYNKAVVVKTMRDNVKLMGQLKKAAGGENFLEAADHLWEFAQGMRALRKYDPPRGSKSDWEKNIEDFMRAAYRGIGASGEKNLDKLNAAIKDLSDLNRQGHRDHK